MLSTFNHRQNPTILWFGGWGLHLIGVGLVARLTHQPLWLAALFILAVGPLYRVYRQQDGLCDSLRSTWPLLLVYTAAGLRILLSLLGSLDDPGLAAFLDLNRWMLLGTIGVLFLQTRAAWRGHFILVATLIWAGLTYFALATHGVTAIDPYGYVQMAVDLAERGTALRIFELAPLVETWGLPLYPTVPLGYTFPDPISGQAGTAWPPGHSVWLAIGYLLAGEPGLYYTTPLLGLLALAAMWLFSLELMAAKSVLEQSQSPARYWAAGLAVFILASGRQQIEWLAVAMSDASAQLWGMLLLLFAMRSQRRRSLLEAGLAGACLGLAFDMRYTQVLLALPALTLLLMPWGQSKRPLARLLAFGGGAALLALPMLAYYTVAFGSPFSTGSREIGHFALANIPANILNMGQGLFASPEFLWLVPLLLWGISSQWRTDRHKLIGLGLAVLILIAFHLPYKLLSIRHLLPIFPILAFWSAAGFVDLLRRLQLKSRPRYWPFLAVGVMLVLLLIRERQTLFLAANPYFATYGYLTSEQRQSFDTLADLTPPEAIIATSLNGGAIVLYAERTIVRPGDWSNADWLTFVEKIAPSERPLYLLVDGVKMEAPLTAVQGRYSLSEEAVLPMTYFFLDGTGVAVSVSLYRVSLE